MSDPFHLDEPTQPTADARVNIQHAGFNCMTCGYDLTGAVIGGACPECGSHINPKLMSSAPTNGMAITSLVMGILSFVVFPVPFAPMGVIFGHIAKNQIRSGRYSQASSGLATAGLICSYIILGLGLLGILILIVMATLSTDATTRTSKLTQGPFDARPTRPLRRPKS
ncbi:MAG: DUF4190 domain-containing protein [Planctomycetota bacterium]